MIAGGLSFDGIIFDLDGTLIDSGGIWQSVDEKFFSGRKLKMPPDYPSAIAHLGFEKAAAYTKKRFHLEEAPEEIVREWENEVVDLYRNELLLKEGAEDFLRLAEKSGCVLGIATAAQKNCYEPCLKRNGIAAFFSDIVDTTRYPSGKRSPEIYLDIAGKWGLSPSRVLVIEDILTALQSARSGGFLTCAIYEKTCKDEKEKRRIGDLYIESFRDLMKEAKEIQR